MIYIDQRVVNLEGYGDCMTAALASLLEIPYEEVPQLRKIQTEGGSWHSVFFGFLKERGFDYHGTFYPRYATRDGVEFIFNLEDLAKSCRGFKGMYMAGGPSPRGAIGGHAVIVNENLELIFDPHPSRQGVPRYDSVHMIEWPICENCKGTGRLDSSGEPAEKTPMRNHFPCLKCQGTGLKPKEANP